MISIRKFLDQKSDKLAGSALKAYCENLDAIGQGSLRICNETGEPLRRDLTRAAQTLTKEATADKLRSTHTQASKSIKLWGDQTALYLKRKTAEVKEILTELSRTSDFFCQRDTKYAAQFSEIARNLDGVTRLEDLGRIRASLLHHAGELRGCVERMAREGNESIAALHVTLATYRAKLEEAQELASLDPLTGLFNRREVEARLDTKVSRQTPFCVVIIDLNGFKLINDRHGHLVGDELLRQMAKELRLASRADDVIGRWGGDEFVLILDGSLTNTKVRMDRMRPWMFGTYELELSGEKYRVVVSASIGMAEWRLGETMLQVIGRADAEMYEEKTPKR